METKRQISTFKPETVTNDYQNLFITSMLCVVCSLFPVLCNETRILKINIAVLVSMLFFGLITKPKCIKSKLISYNYC